MQLRIWDNWRIKQLKEGAIISVILPLEKPLILPPYIPGKETERVHLDLCRGIEAIRIGQLDVNLRENISLPLGRITPDIWAKHIGPGDEEIFIGEVEKKYGLPGFGRFSSIQMLRGNICCLHRVYYELFA